MHQSPVSSEELDMVRIYNQVVISAAQVLGTLQNLLLLSYLIANHYSEVIKLGSNQKFTCHKQVHDRERDLNICSTSTPFQWGWYYFMFCGTYYSMYKGALD